MKIRYLTRMAVMAVVLLALVAALQPAQANCPAAASRTFGYGNSVVFIITPGYTPVSYTSPFVNSVSPNLNAGFWAIGLGNQDAVEPTVGAGADNGVYGALVGGGGETGGRLMGWCPAGGPVGWGVRLAAGFGMSRLI